MRQSQRVCYQDGGAEVDDLMSVLEAHDPADVLSRLTQLKRSLLEKLDAVKHLNDEIVSLTEGEEDLIQEIEEAERVSIEP